MAWAKYSVFKSLDPLGTSNHTGDPVLPYSLKEYLP